MAAKPSARAAGDGTAFRAAARRSTRPFLAGAALVGGFLLASRIDRGHFSATAGLFAIGLAALVGAGKLASP